MLLAGNQDAEDSVLGDTLKLLTGFSQCRSYSTNIQSISSKLQNQNIREVEVWDPASFSQAG
jgi:hypothetical protein